MEFERNRKKIRGRFLLEEFVLIGLPPSLSSCDISWLTDSLPSQWEDPQLYSSCVAPQRLTSTGVWKSHLLVVRCTLSLKWHITTSEWSKIGLWMEINLKAGSINAEAWMSPRETGAMLWSLEPVIVTLFGKSVFADITNDLEMKRPF